MQEQNNTKENNLKSDLIASDSPDSYRDYRNGWKRWLNYHSVVKQVPFLVFLALLAVIYIYNGHYADKMIRNINATGKEVKELQYEFKTIKSEVMFRSQESELVRAVAPLGLKELTLSPVVLSDSSK